MSRYACHDRPEATTFETEIIGAEPGAVLLRESLFYPGGGGQLADRGRLVTPQGEFEVTAIEMRGHNAWHRLSESVELRGQVQGHVDAAFRHLMCQLHTDLHIVNALVFGAFDGALVTGVQMGDDGTARIDFDLPDADNDRIRALEPAVNDAIRSDLRVSATYASPQRLHSEAGLLRSRSVAPPPQPDGSVRIIEIAGLDQQACGGTHLSSTGQSRPVRILKIENKGRHNRRVRIGLA
jgi:misacylated tRNA(Ala) deacylase